MKTGKILRAAVFAAIMLAGAVKVPAGMAVRPAKPVKAIKIEVWKDGAPDSNGLENTDETVKRGMVMNVSKAVLYVYPAPKPTGMGVVMCPGGAYRKEAVDLEGRDMAQWFNARGITFAVLKYRLPNGRDSIPLEDLHQAMRIMRQHSREWGLDNCRVGVMGASAGGHLAACGAVMPADSMAKADFQILLYPVVTMEELSKGRTRDYLMGENPPQTLIQKYTAKNHVAASTPPAFIVMAADDEKVRPVTVMEYISKLISSGVAVEFHLYPFGGHGWGFRDMFVYKQQWTAELDRWLDNLNR